MFWRKKDKTPSPSPQVEISLDAVPSPFPPRSDKDRAVLLQFISQATIAHGPWQGFKQLFKAIEADALQAKSPVAPELVVAMLQRVDALPMGLPVIRGNNWQEVPSGGPRARWDANRLIVCAADGQEGSLSFSGYGQVAQLGNWAIVTSGDYNKCQLHLVDISEAAQPKIALHQELKRVNSYNALAFGARYGDYLILCFHLSDPYTHKKLAVFDVSEKTPREVAGLRLGESHNFQAVLEGERLFFFGGTWNSNALKVVDLKDPTKPKLGGSVTIGNLGWNNNLLAAHNGLAYVVAQGRGGRLKVIDARDPATMRETATLTVKGITSVVSYQGGIYAGVDPRKVKDETEKSRFRVIDDSNPDKPKLLGGPPSTSTVGYLKRRARRLLWKLAEQNPSLYVKVARQLIEANGTTLDLHERWLSVDAVLGKSSRYGQRRHGRAGYQLKNKQFIFKRREERFPEIWDAHPDAALTLWQSEKSPLEAREMALRILRAGKREIPLASVEKLAVFLSSSSPLLQSYASRAAWQHIENGGTLEGKVAALALLAAPGVIRKQLENWVEKTTLNKEEHRAFGVQLQRAVSETRPDGRDLPWRRRDYAARLLVGAWSEFLDQNALLENLSFWLRLSDEKIMARVLEVLRRAGAAKGDELAANLRTLSRQLAKIEENQRELLLEAFLSGSANRTFTAPEALSLVNQEDIAVLGWRLLEVASLPDEVLESLWASLMGGVAISAEALRIAFSDPVALRSFEKAPFDLPSLRGGRNNAAAMFQHGGVAFVEILLRRLDAEHRPTIVLRSLALFKGDDVEYMWNKFAFLADDFQPLERDLERAQFYTYNFEPNERAWDFLERSKIGASVLRPMWRTLFRIAQWSTLSRAFTVSAAPALLRRAEFPLGELEELLKSFPRVWEAASPDFYLALLETLPADQRLQRLIETNDERWPSARAALLRSLDQPSGLQAFWTAVWEKMKSGDSSLKARLLDDEAIVSTFERLEAQSFEPFLKTDDPTHEPWILRWFKAHKPEKGAELLLLAATHNLPGVRKWGLGRAEYLRLDLSSALRLLESDLPDCIFAGRAFFETAEGADELDYALALCDSPGYAARGYGREFIEARRETLFSGHLLARLAQGSSPDMQAWLAEKLLENAAPATATQTFDAAVLRARGRARRAKNLVQMRHEKPSHEEQGAPHTKVDTATLLEIARGRTPRDAQWALRQLAKRALAGEKIEEIEILL